MSQRNYVLVTLEAALLICDWYPKKIGMESKYSSDELLQSADVNCLIRAAQLTGDRIFLAIILKDISFQFLEAGEFDRATEIAKLIHRNQEELFLTSPYREVFYRRFLQSIVFKKISQKLLELGGVENINKALRVAGLMLDTALRSSVLKDVPGKYLEAGEVSFAIKAVEWISIS